MLCASNMFRVLVSAILLSTVTDVAHGLYVPHPELQRAIVHKKVIATWDEAKLLVGDPLNIDLHPPEALLASPVDSGLLEYMKSSIGVNNHTTPYFIGMRLIDNPEQTVIVSLEGIPLDDLSQAALDMIEQIDPQDGDCLRMDSHGIRTGPCLNRLPYICYKNGTTDTTTTSTTASAPTTTTEVTTEITTAITTEVLTRDTTEISTTDTPVDCSSGDYTKLSTGYYNLYKDEATWYEANLTCTAEGGYLVVINNQEEAEVVKDFAFYMSLEPYVLVGVLDRAQDGGWHSVRGEPLDQIYHSWAVTRSYFSEGCGAWLNLGY